MRIAVVTPPAVEPLSITEVQQYCGIDGAAAEPAPGIITVALANPAAAGNVDNGAHRYLATFVTAAGETQAGIPSAAVNVADKAVNGKVQLTGIQIGGAAVTARKLYRTIAGGAAYLLLATIADNVTTTYLDNVADAGLGAGAPSANTTNDPLLNTLISSVRLQAEQELGRKLITQTLDVFFDEFPGAFFPSSLVTTVPGAIVGFGVGPFSRDDAIRVAPIQSVVEIGYTDTTGAAQILDPAKYLVAASSSGRASLITPAYGTSWPATRLQPDAVRVRVVAGYGVANQVPANVKSWMLLRLRTLYNNRDQLDIGSGRISLIPVDFVDGLLDGERFSTGL